MKKSKLAKKTKRLNNIIYIKERVIETEGREKRFVAHVRSKIKRRGNTISSTNTNNNF